ncbi:MAG: cytochrome c-type biogenesis protein CcmH, partial [Rhizobiales bacterium]|nr:cytochrome c-type biogenesis protein CcmH [Hyphomicrobiales bacterium]
LWGTPFVLLLAGVFTILMRLRGRRAAAPPPLRDDEENRLADLTR